MAGSRLYGSATNNPYGRSTGGPFPGSSGLGPGIGGSSQGPPPGARTSHDDTFVPYGRNTGYGAGAAGAGYGAGASEMGQQGGDWRVQLADYASSRLKDEEVCVH